MSQPRADAVPARTIYGYDPSTGKFIAVQVDSAGVIQSSAIVNATVSSQTDIIKILGAAVAKTNPLPIRLTDGTDWLSILPVSLSTLLNPHPVSLASIPNPSNLDVALSTRLKLSDYVITQELGRVGIIITASGSIIDPRDIRALAKATDNLYSVLKTDAGVALDPRDRNWNLGSLDVPDLSDRAARLLGIAYGNKGQLQQRTTSLDLLVQLMVSGVEIDPRSIRALLSTDVLGIVDASGNRMPSMDTSGRRGYVNAEQATRASLVTKPEREDLVSLGGVASPNAAGVQIVAASGSLKPKVYDVEYEILAAGLHYFYFGTSTAATTRRFLTRQTTGVNSKTFVQPRVGDAGDGIYLYSAVSETNMPYDLGYVLE